MQKQGVIQKLSLALAAVVVALSLAGVVGMVSTDQAFAASADQKITVSVQGTGISEDWTYQDLVDEGLIVTSSSDGLLYPAGYQYLKPSGDWFVVGAQNYVRVSDLISKSGITSEDWNANKKIMFITEDYTTGYDKYYPSYSEIEDPGFFYPNIGATGAAPLTGKIQVPAVIAFDSSQTEIADGSTASATLAGSSFSESIRFCCGLTDGTINLSGANMGKRMPSLITEIVIIPA